MNLSASNFFLWSWAALSSALALLGLWGCWTLHRRANAVGAQLHQVSGVLTQSQSYDPVTGLFAPQKLDSELEDAALRCDASGQSLHVVVIDLDHFRSANDAFGRATGDAVLKEAGLRIAAQFSLGTPVARLGGNEFVVLCTGTLTSAKDAAAKVQGALCQPMVSVDGSTGQVRLTCSVGIATYPEQGSRRQIVDKAAAAMRTVKLQGGDGFAQFDQSAADGRRDSARLVQDLRCAVERSELELFYQPKIDAGSLQITAVESLVRWRHPQLGMVSPDRFIGLAERFGLIDGIGRWVIEEACRQAAIWRGQGLRMRIAVNISGQQMRKDDFAEHVRDVLEFTQTHPSRFTCEITESIAMEDTAVTTAAFARLGELGVHVSIDDFGTGHSSLASLKRLPAQELKIDRAFVTDLATSEHAYFIANTIVTMAHTLNLRVVAEGVETRQQRDLLVQMGCDELQGYLFAKPMRAEELGRWAVRDHGYDSGDRQGSDKDALFRPSIYAETTSLRVG